MDIDLAHIGICDDDDIEIDLAALRLSKLDRCGHGDGPQRAILSKIEESLAETSAFALDGEEQALLLAHVLFGEFGFSVCDDPNGATSDRDDMTALLDSRRGSPFILGILYVAMAKRAGWSAAMLAIPEFVLISIGPPEGPCLIDPSKADRILSARSVEQHLAESIGPYRFKPETDLRPLSNRATVGRLLAREASLAETRGDVQRASLICARLTTIAPQDEMGWWERARLQLALEDTAGARASLSALLETTRNQELRSAACALLEAIDRY